MRFDQLPTELLVMIATQSDMITRGCVIKTSTRMRDIYGKLPHYKSVDRIGISRIRRRHKFHYAIVIHDSSLASETHFTEDESPFNSNFLIIGNIGELSFQNMDCANCPVSNILGIFPTLKFTAKMTFDNCDFMFTGSLLSEIVAKIDPRSIEIKSPSLVNYNVQRVLYDKFFSSFKGDFQFTVEKRRKLANMRTGLSNNLLSELMKNPRKVFKLNNVINDFTLPYLTLAVRAMIFSNWKVNWNLGVILIPIEEQIFFHNGIYHTLLEATLTVNANYASNNVDVEGVPCTQYKVSRQHSLITFTVQYCSSIPTSRKRAQSRKRDESSSDDDSDYDYRSEM